MRRSKSTDLRPGWVSAPSDEFQDLVKLEDRFRKLHTRESSMLDQRMRNYNWQHQQLMSRQMQSTPLVICAAPHSGGYPLVRRAWHCW